MLTHAQSYPNIHVWTTVWDTGNRISFLPAAALFGKIYLLDETNFIMDEDTLLC